jgi:hypothetical protein
VQKRARWVLFSVSHANCRAEARAALDNEQRIKHSISEKGQMQPPLKGGPTEAFFLPDIGGKNGKNKMSHGNQTPTTLS